MSKPRLDSVPIANIEIGHRCRNVDPTAVKAIADSMSAIGLRTPVSLRAVYDGEGVGELHLVAGAHRLEAAKLLGWVQIAAFVHECDEGDAEMWEIAENLHRAELTVQERAGQIARWVELVEQKDKLVQVGQVLASGGRGKEGGESKAARELNLTRQEVRRAKKIASITPEAQVFAKERGLADNQSKLLQVAAQPPEKQAAKVIELAGQPGRTNVKPRGWRDQFADLWDKASDDDRLWARRFMDGEAAA